ncbi:hypothetical protein OH76DRAFT_1490809 [Lentinus brumalis]|uniref:Uncharacterized protein n=1 Tax=Lentinus brumalis TaxID=2498619 RepID=A0A371CHS9_9APHY|nr:hypothetical protein OH76DRAFT_1490809 [Polyporus brumalis]
MPFSLDSYPKLSITADDIGATDGLVAARDVEANLLVTSPNAHYIPKLPLGRVSIYMVADGTYGALDPACWPQIYHRDFAYFAAVSKAVTSPHPHSAIWNRPTQADFRALEGVPAPNYGSLTEEFVQPLRTLVFELQERVTAHTSLHRSPTHTPLLHHQCVAEQTCERLRTVPATLRDHEVQVSLLRRHWLLAMAYMRYANHMNIAPRGHAAMSAADDIMGAWTWEADVVDELVNRGIPVWFVRNRVIVPSHTRIGREVGFVEPPAAYVARMCDIPVYQGNVGYESLLATQRTTQTYHDISRHPIVSSHTVDSALQSHAPSYTTPPPLESRLPAKTLETLCPTTVYPTSKSAHRSQVRDGRDKFKEIKHPWMPPSIPSWQRALSEVDRSHPAKHSTEIWAYWIPEPALLISPKTPERQRRYMLSWLRARPAWISLLQLPERRVSLNPQMWRTYLNGIPLEENQTAHGRRTGNIRSIFRDILKDDEVEHTEGVVVDWHDHSFSEVPEALCPWILWETYELGFHYELLALDRACCSTIQESQAQDRIARVFGNIGLFSVTHLPAADEPGLFAPVPHRRISALNALRDVVMRWPECPELLQAVTPLSTLDTVATVEAFEYWLATVYTRAFFTHAGRAPILPHFPPLPL